MSKEVKVGIVVLVAFIAFLVSYWFLDNMFVKSSTYEIFAYFDSIEKIDKGAQVRLSGFKIGTVTAIELTSDLKAKVTMKIDNKIKIPSDSKSLATSGAIIGEIFIKIVPGKRNNYLKNKDSINAISNVNFDEITNNVNNLLILTEESMKHINEILSNKGAIISTLDNINGITKNVDSITKNVNALMTISQMDLRNTIANIASASDSAASMAKDIEVFVKADAIPSAKNILVSAEEVMGTLKEAIISAKGIVDDVHSQTGNLPNILDRIDKILAKMDYTTIQTQQVMMNLNEASASVNSIVSDDQLRHDLLDTASNIKEATQQAKELVTSLNQRFGNGKSGDDNKISASVNADTYYNTKKEKLVLDTFADVYVGTNGIKMGFNDLGESNKFTLMYGKKLNSNNILRGGLYRSSLGVGYDYVAGPFGISADIYRPNDPSMFLKGKYMLNKNLGVLLGVNDLFHRYDRDLMLGMSLQY